MRRMTVDRGKVNILGGTCVMFLCTIGAGSLHLEKALHQISTTPAKNRGVICALRSC